jgi:hypothetical protein
VSCQGRGDITGSENWFSKHIYFFEKKKHHQSPPKKGRKKM